MLGACSSLELSETKHKSPEDTEENMTSGSSKDAFSSGASTESVRMEARQCLKSATAWYKKQWSSHPGSSVK